MKKKARNIILVLVFLIGLGVFYYPTLTNKINEYKNQNIIKQYNENKEDLYKESQSTKEEESQLDILLKKMEEYNEKIYSDKQKDLKDPFSYEESSFDLTEFGFSDNVFGYISIPIMEIELPIYLGANHENMAKGAVQMSQTSLPIGGENTNSVIAAHRGYKYQAMFRDIEALNIGDEVKITNLWDTLEYRVCEIKIIDPSDVPEVLIQEGRDLVTLITCHPYTKNYKRYVVYCERVNNDISQNNNETSTINKETSSVGKASTDEDNILKTENAVRGLMVYIIVFAIFIVVIRFIWKSLKNKINHLK